MRRSNRTPKVGAALAYCVDDDERQALQAEGLDPDDPAVIAATNRIC